MFKMAFTAAALTLCTSVSFANDGGIAAIKVDQIKMRETALKNDEEVVVRKMAKPRFTITIEGGEAKKLQQLLPSQVSVLTSMQPELADQFNHSFKTLGIYSNKSDAASSKVILISCSDAELVEIGDGSAMAIRQLGKTTCTITIDAPDKVESPADMLGDVQSFEPKTCK